jgi:uncharacterized protein (DUF885 family)
MTAPAPSPALAGLADRLLEHLLATDPLEATLMGFRQHDAHLADLSIEAEAARAMARAQLRSEVESIDAAALTDEDVLTRAVILAQLRYSDDAMAVDALAYTVAAFAVTPSSILLSYLRMVVATDAQQAHDYVARLSEIPRFLAQAQERLQHGRAAGLTPVAHLVAASITQIDRFLAASPSPLIIAARIDGDVEARWRSSLEDVLARDVIPAFAAHRAYLRDEVLPTARSVDEVGLLHLPDGVERYSRLVRIHTTTDRTPAELHQLGLDLVASVHDEFRSLGGRLFGITDVREIFDHLKSDPSLRWDSAAEILEAAEQTVRRAEAASPAWFGRLPRAICALDAIPELESEGAPPAYYMQPALDGSRPGTYFSNVNEPGERTSFDLESIAFHEAVPGHHLQVSLALELPDLPMVRRLSMFTAYVEGWGLYSERLADEMGLYSSELQRIGMLSADVWRASRLVVDTGMHAFGWTRQQAVDYLLESTPVAPIDVESEIDRYIAYPGQALSYMTGRTEIELLRARAQSALGDAFDIRDFHDAVLGSGALPLAVLAEVVDAWIARQG